MSRERPKRPNGTPQQQQNVEAWDSIWANSDAGLTTTMDAAMQPVVEQVERQGAVEYLRSHEALREGE